MQKRDHWGRQGVVFLKMNVKGSTLIQRLVYVREWIMHISNLFVKFCCVCLNSALCYLISVIHIYFRGQMKIPNELMIKLNILCF